MDYYMFFAVWIFGGIAFFWLNRVKPKVDDSISTDEGDDEDSGEDEDSGDNEDSGDDTEEDESAESSDKTD